MTIIELEALGYTITKIGGDTWLVEADGVIVYVSGDGLLDLEMPDTTVAAAEQAALAAAPKIALVDPLDAVAALDPAKATVADIINAIKAAS